MADPVIVLTAQQLRELVREAVREAISTVPANDQPEYLTRAQLAELLGCSTRTIRNWMDQGLPVVYAGASPRYSRAAVTAWLEGRKLKAVK